MRHIKSELETKPFILMAFNTDLTDESTLIKSIGLTDYIELEGCWDSKIERSYAVFFNDLTQKMSLIDLALKHNQDSIIAVDSDRRCTLYDLNQVNQHHIGSLVCVPKEEALLSQGYSKVLKTDRYFIVK